MFKIKQSRIYITMTNYHLKDINLSFAAKGLQSWLLANLSSWDSTFENILVHNNITESELVTLLNELQEHGYIESKNEDIIVLDKPLNVAKKQLNPLSVKTVKSEPKKVKSLYEKCLDINESFTSDVKVRAALREYLLLRINPPKDSRLKAFPITNVNQWRSLVNSLIMLPGDIEKSIRQSIGNEWAKFVAYTSSKDNLKSNSYTKEEIQRFKDIANNEEGLIF